MSEPTSHQPRSLKLFKKAAPEVQLLVKQIMTKERQEQYKKVRDKIHQTLLQYVKESTP